MKKIYLLIMILLSLNVYSQNERINTVIFMDGKLVDVDNAFFSYRDTLGIEHIMNFRSYYGEIQIKQEYYQKIISLESGFTEHCGNTGKKPDSLFINFDITECQGQCKYHYKALIPPIYLYRSITGELIIRITNLNKKKTKYDIRYTAGIWIEPWGKKEKKVIFEPEWNLNKRKCR